LLFERWGPERGGVFAVRKKGAGVDEKRLIAGVPKTGEKVSASGGGKNRSS